MSRVYYSAIMLAVLAFVGFCSYAQNTNQITGKWKTEDKSKEFCIEIYLAKDSNYYGGIINNNFESTKNSKLVLKKLSFNEKSREYKGVMEPPDAGISLEVTVTIANIDKLKLVAKKFLISKTIYLIRIK